MLSHLHIRNLAVIDEVEVEFTAGLTVLSGETGAGKSILVDALGLLLGDRADSGAVRTGAQRAEIAAHFELAPEEAASRWLSEHDLDDDGQCLVRRVITPEGRSRGYINGNPVAMQTLKEIGPLLVDICGQQAHQTLMQTSAQKSLLDQHGGHGELLTAVGDLYRQWHEVESARQALLAARADREARLELLRYQVEELGALAPKPDELEQLEQAHRRAANASRIGEVGGQVIAMLFEQEDGSAHDVVSRARSSLDELAAFDPAFEAVSAMLAEAEIQISEATDELRHRLSGLDADPALLQETEQRLAAMHELARKHQARPEELHAVFEKLSQELDQLEHSDEALESLTQEATRLRRELDQRTVALSDARAAAGESLGKAVTAGIRELGMPDGEFAAAVETPSGDDTEPGASGIDRVEFRVALNPGQSAGPLSRVASGGELSRVSLALQVAAQTRSQAGTLVFDEVDAGIGGGTAEIVGDKLRQLAQSNQVLCVTHLPQVASQGHRQLRVSKLSDGKNTRTSVRSLSDDERVEEIARMLGGVEITDRTRDHAMEMLGRAQERSTA